jgi:hypothetical protein
VKVKGPWIVQLLIGNRFDIQCQCDHNLWVHVPKSKGIIYWPKLMYLCNLRAKGPWVVKLLIGNCFNLQWQCDIDLWPIELKDNRGNLLAKTNVLTKFEGEQPIGCQVIHRKPLQHTRTIWPWPLTFDPLTLNR